MVVVTFEGFTFYGGTEQPTGFFLNDEGLVGWSDGVDPRVELNPRPRAHGSFGVAKTWRGNRVVTVNGRHVAASVAEAKQARLVLSALQSSGVPSQFTVADDELGLTMSITATLVAAPTVPEQVVFPWFDYSFDVVATDPRRYGPVLTSGPVNLPSSGGGIVYPFVYPVDYGAVGELGQIQLVNSGYMNSFPLLKVTGGLGGGFSLVCVETADEIRLERPIPLGQTAFVNTRTGRVWLDAPANDITGFLTRSDWFDVPKLSTRTVQFNGLGVVTGTPMLSGDLSSAY